MSPCRTAKRGAMGTSVLPELSAALGQELAFFRREGVDAGGGDLVEQAVDLGLDGLVGARGGSSRPLAPAPALRPALAGPGTRPRPALARRARDPSSQRGSAEGEESEQQAANGAPAGE